MLEPTGNRLPANVSHAYQLPRVITITELVMAKFSGAAISEVRWKAVRLLLRRDFESSNGKVTCGGTETKAGSSGSRRYDVFTTICTFSIRVR